MSVLTRGTNKSHPELPDIKCLSKNISDLSRPPACFPLSNTLYIYYTPYFTKCQIQFSNITLLTTWICYEKAYILTGVIKNTFKLQAQRIIIYAEQYRTIQANN